MPFIPIANTAEIRIKGHDITTLQPVENVLHCVLATADQTAANVANIALAIKTAVAGQLGAFSGDLQFDSVTCRGLSSVTAPESVVSFSPGTTGSAGAVKDPTASGLVKLFTALRGRSYRGRVYWGGLSDLAITAGTYALTSGQVTAYTNLMSAISSALVALTPASELAVASRKHGTSEIVTAFLVESLIATQRRRLPRP